MSLADTLSRVQDKVERLLRMHPDTRNNDLYLQWLYLMEYERIPLPTLKFSKFIELSSVMESIRRCRQKLQNDMKMYPPTNLETAKRRGWAEEEWKEFVKK
jgi:hypothetical protein